MFNIVNNTIIITRGDSAVFHIEIENPNTKELYELQPGDKVILSVKPDKKNADYLFQLEGPTFNILPEHTKDADPSMKYYYDIELRFANQVDIHTVVEKSLFTIKEGVTND